MEALPSSPPISNLVRYWMWSAHLTQKSGVFVLREQVEGESLYVFFDKGRTTFTQIGPQDRSVEVYLHGAFDDLDTRRFFRDKLSSSSATSIKSLIYQYGVIPERAERSLRHYHKDNLIRFSFCRTTQPVKLVENLPKSVYQQRLHTPDLANAIERSHALVQKYLSVFEERLDTRVCMTEEGREVCRTTPSAVPFWAYQVLSHLAFDRRESVPISEIADHAGMPRLFVFYLFLQASANSWISFVTRYGYLQPLSPTVRLNRGGFNSSGDKSGDKTRF